VLIFCIAGLLFIVLRARSNIGSVSHPVGDRPSHPNLVNGAGSDGRCNTIQCVDSTVLR